MARSCLSSAGCRSSARRHAGFHPQHHLEERLGKPLPQEVLDRRIGRRTEMILANAVLPGVLQHLDAARRSWPQAGRGLELDEGVGERPPRPAGHPRTGSNACAVATTWRTRSLTPDLYIAVLDCLGVSASEAIAIEDSPNGVTAAKRAGMRCVAIPNTITARLDLSAGRPDAWVAGRGHPAGCSCGMILLQQLIFCRANRGPHRRRRRARPERGDPGGGAAGFPARPPGERRAERLGRMPRGRPDRRAHTGGRPRHPAHSAEPSSAPRAPTR